MTAFILVRDPGFSLRTNQPKRQSGCPNRRFPVVPLASPVSISPQRGVRESGWGEARRSSAQSRSRSPEIPQSDNHVCKHYH